MLGIMPTSQKKRGQVKFQWSRKRIEPWESQKAKEPKKTQMLEGMPKSQEKVITKIKWVYSSKAMKKKKKEGQIKEERQKKIWMTSKVKLLIVIFSLWNPETLFEPYILFFYSQKPQPTLRACRSLF